MIKFLTGALAALSLSLATPTATMAPAVDRTAAAQLLGRPTVSNDGYYLEATPENNTRFYVRIVKYKSYEEVASAWKKKGGDVPDVGRIVAFAEWTKDGNSCVIHMVDPKITYRPQFIGHELVHCMHGDFHPTQ